MIYIHAALKIRQGQRAAFDAYEVKALASMAAFGGRLVAALIPEDVNAAGADEIHVLAFRSREDFDAWRTSAHVESLKPEREACIVSTKILFLRENSALA